MKRILFLTILCLALVLVASLAARKPANFYAAGDLVVPTVSASSQCDTVRQTCHDIADNLFNLCRATGGLWTDCHDDQVQRYAQCVVQTSEELNIFCTLND